MARGILSGIGLGAVFSVGVAGVVSVLVPIEPQPAPLTGQSAAGPADVPQPATATVTATPESGSTIEQPQVSLRAPIGEELPKEPAAAARAPQIETDLSDVVQAPAPAPPAAEIVAPQQSETETPAPLPDAPERIAQSAQPDAVPQAPQPLPQPQTGSAADLTAPRPLPHDVRVRIEEDPPVLPNPQALAPMIPDDSQDQDVAEETAAPLAPPVEGEEILVVVPPTPEPAVTADSTPIAEHDEDAPTQITEGSPAQLDEEPEQPDEERVVIAQAPKPRVLPSPDTQGTLIGNSARPRIGTPANTLISRTETEGAGAPVETLTQAPAQAADDTPLRRYSRAFENPEGKPLMSIVLIDNGVDLDADGIGLAALSSFPYPVSFAVDVRLEDAAKRMKRYRAEGFDVLAMVDLPSGARPSDAEVSLSVALNGMPEIVGVLEGTGEGLQGSREVADQVTGILKASGHGLVTQNKGLNSMPKLAVKDGVPAAPVFRDFDSQGQKARVIRRFLDQAAFKAGQEGGVIMLGRLRPETIEALLVWGLADRAGSVALAPVSALLLSQR